MGEPVRIADLAERMIRLAGYKPNIDIKIEYVGLRPGEKLFEELFDAREVQNAEQHESYSSHRQGWSSKTHLKRLSGTWLLP